MLLFYKSTIFIKLWDVLKNRIQNVNIFTLLEMKMRKKRKGDRRRKGARKKPERLFFTFHIFCVCVVILFIFLYYYFF